MPKDTALNTRGRGTYAAQACNVCRSKKIKCDGIKPICGSCGGSGRDSECSWGRNIPVRKPRTEAHFESLRKRADALQAYVDFLEGMLSKCMCQDVSTRAQYRPDQAREYYSGREASDSDLDTLDSEEEITRELCVPVQALKLDDKSGGLLHHGSTAPMRFLTKSTKEVLPIAEIDTPNASGAYVLLIDGVDIPEYDPDFDWARHLPPEVLLSRKEHDKILDLSFKFFTMLCLRLAPCLFLRDMHRALSVPRTRPPPKTPYYSPLLHNAILGISAIFSDDPHIRESSTRRCFVTAAKSHLEAECLKPDLSLVHALGLIATFHGNEGEHIMADLYHGMSARLSQSLGLEVDASAWVKSGLITNEERLARNWAHWSIFSTDLCWSLYVGREFCTPPRDRPTIALPFVSTELDQIPWHYPPANIPPQPNLLSCVFAASTSLLLIGRKIVDVVNGLERSTREDGVHNDNLVTEIDLELNVWKDQLPPDLDVNFSNRARSTPQRLMLHCMYWWCIVVLHRPFFNRRSPPVYVSDAAVDHVKLCKRAADNILELLETWSSLYSLRYTPPPMLQIIFSAGTVFVLLSLHATSSLRIAQGSLKVSLSQAELCLQYLSEMSTSWKAAGRTGDILRSLIEDRLKPTLERRFANDRSLRSASDSPPARHAARQREPERQRTSQSIPRDGMRSQTLPNLPPSFGAPPHTELGWDLPLHPDLQVPVEYVRAERYQLPLGLFGEAELEAGVLDAHAEPGSSGRSGGADLDMASFFLPQSLDSIAPDIWEDGLWGVRRGDLTGYYA
ncbi:hypothetical protein FB451DRAFT_128986 [Mycena latifolia]|nr:hypothetical protein FB451DRAFT_128986 [Mycena latifolia]